MSRNVIAYMGWGCYWYDEIEDTLFYISEKYEEETGEEFNWYEYLESKLENTGVGFETHGSGEGACSLFLYVKGTLYRAYWGNATSLMNEKLTKAEIKEYQKRLDKALKKIGIEDTIKGTWFIAAYSDY